MAEMRSRDVETAKTTDRLGRCVLICLVVDVVRRNGAGTELGACVAALAGDELCLAIGALHQQGLVAGRMPGSGQV